MSTLIAGCTASAEPSAEGAITNVACADFASEFDAMHARLADYVNDYRDKSGQMTKDFLARLDTVALSATNEAVQDRMFTVIESFPTMNAIMRGYGTDYEPWADSYDSLARACAAAGTPIEDAPRS